MLFDNYYRKNTSVMIIIALSSITYRTALGQDSAHAQSLYNAYFSTTGGFQALAQLHNNLVSEPLVVTPVVRASDGSGTVLRPVTLSPLGNATIDIGAALAAEGRSEVQSGSMEFEYHRRIPVR